MAWQKFQSTNQKFEERISISTNYSFGFPKTFYDRNNLEDYKYLVIFYDPEEKAIGFQFTNNQDEKHKFHIYRSKEKYGVSVTAKSFFNTYNIDPKTFKGKYTGTKTDVDGIGTLYTINLNEHQNKVEDALNEPTVIDTSIL